MFNYIWCLIDRFSQLINIYCQFLGYKQTFSKETYTVSKIYKSFPPRYALQDEDGDLLDSMSSH